MTTIGTFTKPKLALALLDMARSLVLLALWVLSQPRCRVYPSVLAGRFESRLNKAVGLSGLGQRRSP